MRVVPTDAAIASGKNEVVTVTAKNQGAWANTMQVSISRVVRGKTQIMSVVSETQYQLKNVTGFCVGDIVSYRNEGGITYNKITAINGTMVTFSSKLSDDAVDTSLVPTKTVELCGLQVVVSCGGQEERYSNCSLNEARPEYLPTLLEKSQMVQIDLKIQEDPPNDLLVLLGGIHLYLFGGWKKWYRFQSRCGDVQWHRWWSWPSYRIGGVSGNQ